MLHTYIDWDVRDYLTVDDALDALALDRFQKKDLIDAIVTDATREEKKAMEEAYRNLEMNADALLAGLRDVRQEVEAMMGLKSTTKNAKVLLEKVYNLVDEYI